MADLSNVDLQAVIERVAPVRFGKVSGTGSKRAVKGNCPFCGLGTDRFAVFIGETPHRYVCGVHGNGCKAKGDAIDFLMHYQGTHMSYPEACAELGVDPGSKGTRAANHATKAEVTEPPCTQWQTQAVALVKAAIDFLWSDCETARKALVYLHNRGLSDETIRQAWLGFIPKERYELRSEWGLPDIDNGKTKPATIKLSIPRGWVIPWRVERAMWRVDIRRLNIDIKKALEAGHDAPKYHMLAGSRNALYNADSIKDGMPLVVCESPLDALSGQQSTGSAAWVATGSTGGARARKWIDAMLVAMPVLVAFDDDKNDAGNKAFQYWSKTDIQPFRCMPWDHDINDMLVAGMDIAAWLADGLESAMLLSTNTSQDDETLPASQDNADEPIAHCYDCGLALTETGFAVTWLVDEDRDSKTWGDEFCMDCWEARNGTNEPEPTLTPEQHIAPIASVFPGCTVRMLPSGMSTSDYIDSFYAEPREQKQSLASESGQERFWRELHERLGGKAWDDYIAKQNAIQRERIAAIATLPFTPQPERPTPSAVATLPQPEEDVSDAALLQRYKKALEKAKKGPVFLTPPLVANGFYSRQAALDAVQSALQCGDGRRREAALDEMHFREHGEYRKIR